jgi:hypothetical protein
MTKYFSFYAALTAAGSALLLWGAPASAATFSYKEDTAGLREEAIAPTITTVGNTRTITNAITYTNTDAAPTPEVIFLAPFIITNVNGNLLSLSWENSLDAWISDNYDGLGNRLAVSLTNATGRIRLDTLADLTGQAPIPLTLPCTNSPSCIPALPPGFPTLSQDGIDEIPFFSFGSFAAGETKSLDVVFNFDYEDGRTGTLPLLPFFGTFSAVDPAAVPEPTAVLGLMVVGAIATTLKRSGNSKAA